MLALRDMIRRLDAELPTHPMSEDLLPVSIHTFIYHLYIGYNILYEIPVQTVR